ncbi:MAG TPA: XdhC family protein [Pyrinomonadaceae bacterium]|nr:XdhC family protein [Pyrinomonadaceae bacterium]
MNIEDQCNLLRGREEPFVLATVVAYKNPQSAKPGSKAIIKPDGTMLGWIGGGCVQPIVLREAKLALQTGQSKLLTISPDAPREDWQGVQSFRMTCEGGGSLEIYLEPFLPKPRLVILGSSPVAETLAQLGALLEFKVVAVTDLSNARDQIDENSYVVVATMGNRDEEGLLAVIGTRPKYLGLVASRKKADALFEYVRSVGTSDEDLAVIKSPAGLDIGSESMSEIALSVAAELVRVRRTSFDQVQTVATALDPICGMTVDIENPKYSSVVDGQTIYFCCLRCKETFDHPQISQITQLGRKSV